MNSRSNNKYKLIYLYAYLDIFHLERISLGHYAALSCSWITQWEQKQICILPAERKSQGYFYHV